MASPFVKPRLPAIERAAQFVAKACPLRQAEAQPLRSKTGLGKRSKKTGPAIADRAEGLIEARRLFLQRASRVLRGDGQGSILFRRSERHNVVFVIADRGLDFQRSGLGAVIE